MQDKQPDDELRKWFKKYVEAGEMLDDSRDLVGTRIANDAWDELETLIRSRERAAYHRGYDDGVASFGKGKKAVENSLDELEKEQS